jgi:hypothetical protein
MRDRLFNLRLTPTTDLLHLALRPRYVEGGVHYEPSHAYVPRSDSPGFEPTTFCVLGMRLIEGSEKNGCRLVASCH